MDAFVKRRVGAGSVADLESAADFVESVLETFASAV
jgi:hypothetical protein